MATPKILQPLGHSCAALALVCTGGASALGLGEISVDSALNQRFAASIPLLSPTPQQRDSVSVHIATAEDFARAGIEWTDYMSTLRFHLLDEAGGTRVVIDSEELVREPYLNLVVEASWAGGRLLREYTVLLDPPKELNLLPSRATGDATAITPDAAPGAVRSPAPPPAPPVSAFGPTPAPARPALRAPATPVAMSHRPPVAAATGHADALFQYGPVRAHEQPRAIAARLHPGPGVTQEQVELALYRANPQAFSNGRLDRMVPGAMLSIPPLEAIQAVPAESARAIIQDMRAKLGLIRSAPTVPVPHGQTALPLHQATAAATTRPSASMTAKAVRAPAPAVALTVPSSVTPAPAKLETPISAATALAPLPATTTAVAPKPHAAPASPNLAAQQPHPVMGPRQWATLRWIGLGGSVLIALCALADLARARRRKMRRTEPAPATIPQLAVPAVPPPAPPVATGDTIQGLLQDAEFCQLYGRFTDAVQLIETVVTQAPDDQKLRFKLAEAYFAADMREPFKRTAAALEGKLDQARQQELASMLDSLSTRSSAPLNEPSPGRLAA